LGRNVKTSRLTESALITGILVIFAMIGNFIFPFIDFIYPLPAIILAKRYDYKASVMSLVSAGLIIFMMLGVQMGLYYIVLYTPMAAIMGYFISKDKKPYKAVLTGGLAYLISFVILLMIMQAFLSINLVDYVRETFVESLKIQESIMSNFGGMEEQLETTKTLYENMMNAIILLFPAMIIFSSISMSYVNYFVVQKLGKRLGVSIVPMIDFSMFRLPSNISIGMLIFLGGTYIISKTEIVNSEALSANIMFIFQILFLIQGLAVAKFFMLRNKLPRLFMGLMFFLILFNNFLTLLATMVGLVDTIVDIRKIKKFDRW
jgi:uncharacterized protein YybS (DUF2232 family)